jgi:hypothetical protein
MASARDQPKLRLLESVEYVQKTSVLDIKMHRIFFLDGGIPLAITQTYFDLTCDTQEFL